MNFVLMALLISLTQLQSATAIAVNQSSGIQPFATSASIAYYSRGINLRDPRSGSVLAAEAIRAGRVRIPFSGFRQLIPEVLTCSPAPCVTPNVQASEGGSPVNEDPIAANPNKPLQLLSGGNDYNCSSVQGFFASQNGGTTWNHTCMNLLSGTFGDGDPAVGYDLKNHAYIAGIDATSGTVSEIAFEKSSNNGLTWSAPAPAVLPIAPYTFADKEWMQIDDTPTSPRKNAIYISTTEFDPSSNSIIAVAHSTNGGGSWTNVMVDAATYPVVDQFSDLGIGKDGKVYLTWMRCKANGPNNNCGGTTSMIMFSKSSDGGIHWTAPVVISNANLAPDPCGAFYGCLPNTGERVSNVPPIDVDRSSGAFSNRLYTAFYNWTGTRMQMLVSRSSNGGATWSRPVAVAGRALRDEFFPWLTTASDGTVGVTWLDRRLDAANVNYDTFATVSTNGGVSFGANVRVSKVSSNPFNDGFSGSFMGDYTGNIWVAKTLYASWMDTRSTVNAQDWVGGYRLH
jgi:hypothetical protein